MNTIRRIRIAKALLLSMLIMAITQGVQAEKLSRVDQRVMVCVDQEDVRLDLDLTLRTDPRVWKLIHTENCKVQNDGSTWCDFHDCDDNGDCKITHACHSDWDGNYCNGDEVED